MARELVTVYSHGTIGRSCGNTQRNTWIREIEVTRHDGSKRRMHEAYCPSCKGWAGFGSAEAK